MLFGVQQVGCWPGEENSLLRFPLLPCRCCSHLLVSAFSVPSSATSRSPGNHWTCPQRSCPGPTAPSRPLGSASPTQVGGSRTGGSHPPSASAPLTPPLSLHCRRVGVAAAHPPGAGSGHRHGHRLQHELSGLLRAVQEAAASPPAAPPRLQPGALHRRAGQPPGRAAGHAGGHGRQHRQRLRRRPHAGMPGVREEGWQGMGRRWSRRCGGPVAPRLPLSQRWERQVCTALWGQRAGDDTLHPHFPALHSARLALASRCK